MVPLSLSLVSHRIPDPTCIHEHIGQFNDVTNVVLAGVAANILESTAEKLIVSAGGADNGQFISFELSKAKEFRHARETSKCTRPQGSPCYLIRSNMMTVRSRQMNLHVLIAAF